MKNDLPENVASSSPNAQSQLLRAHVEREVRRASVIMVTSARPGDGKSVTAHALARSLAQTGHRTALVSATSHGAPGLQWGGVDFLAFPTIEPGRFREVTNEFLSSSRATYDYTIVDTAPLLADATALGLAGSVDGVILTVRVGRPPTEDDESTMRIIEQSSGRIIGVVAALPDAIDDFERLRRATSGDAEAIARATVHVESNAGSLKTLQTLVVSVAIVVFGSFYALASVAAPIAEWSRTTAALH